MKNRKTLFFVFSFLFLLASCSVENPEKEVKPKKNKLKIEPPSELALLMKSMKKQSISIQEAVLKGDTVDLELLEAWKRIHAAKPTEKDKKTPIYHGFADAFLMSVDSFKMSRNNKSSYFNNMITACVDCHIELCPGPVSTINKLKIK